jgi:hypothetical protein
MDLNLDTISLVVARIECDAQRPKSAEEGPGLPSSERSRNGAAASPPCSIVGLVDVSLVSRCKVLWRVRTPANAEYPAESHSSASDKPESVPKLYLSSLTVFPLRQIVTASRCVFV